MHEEETMRIKTASACVTATLVILALTSCGAAATATPVPELTMPPATETPTVAPTEPVIEEASGPVEPLDVAFLCTDVVDDRSWNQWIYEGLSRLQSEGEINLSVSEQVDLPDYERIATEYAEEGYDLIMGNTTEFQDPSMAVAEKYPDLHFAVVTGWLVGPNHAEMTVHEGEGAYLAGMLAASLTKTGKVGVVGAFEYPTQIACHEGFKLGARAVNPDIEVQEAWTGTWYDVNMGYEAGQAMIDSGVDVIFVSVSGPGFGAIEAAKDHGPDVMAIGSFVDMHEVAPENVVTSVFWDSYPTVKAMLYDIRAGTFGGTTYQGTVANGGTGLTPYWGFESKIPEDVKILIRDTTEQITNGNLVVPWIGEVPEK
jgi:basic membrane protein A